MEIYWKPLLFLKVYYIKLGLILALKTLLGIKIYAGYYSKIIRYGYKINHVQLSSVFFIILYLLVRSITYFFDLDDSDPDICLFTIMFKLCSRDLFNLQTTKIVGDQIYKTIVISQF